MLYQKFTTALLLTIVAISSSLAMQQDNSLNSELKSWTPLRLHQPGIFRQIEEFIAAEKPTSIKNTETDKRDYGFSFPGVTPIQAQCLSEIKTRYEKQKKRPMVLDLGAGHGFMTWKMIVAGGFVHAVEGQKPTAEVLQNTVRQAKPFLAKDESLKTVYLGYVDDVLKFDTCIAYQKMYAVTWSGNLLHLMTPAEIRAYLKNLYKITIPGGYAFATANAPCSVPEICEHYLQAQKLGEEFPGYMVVNKMIYRSLQTVISFSLLDGPQTNEKQKNIQIEVTGPIAKAANGSLPNIESNGYHNEPPQEKPEWILHEEKPNIKSHEKGNHILTQEKIVKRKAHSVMHFFDTKVLRKLFEDEGFVVEDVYYITKEGKRGQANLSVTDLAKDIFNVGIKARKPEAPIKIESSQSPTTKLPTG